MRLKKNIKFAVFLAVLISMVCLWCGCGTEMVTEPVEYDFSEEYEDIVYQEVQLSERIPGQVILGELDSSGHQHFINLANQAAEEEQIPDELESIQRAVEDKLTQPQIDSLIDLDFDELLRFIEETGDVPAWLDEIIEIFQEDSTLNFLIPKVSPPKVIPPEEIIGSEDSAKAPSSLFLQLEPAAAPSADDDACFEDKKTEIENAYQEKLKRITALYNKRIGDLASEYKSKIESENKRHDDKMIIIGVGGAACLFLLKSAACIAMTAAELKMENKLHRLNIKAIDKWKEAEKKWIDVKKKKAERNVRSEKDEALKAAKAACHDQGGGA